MNLKQYVPGRDRDPKLPFPDKRLSSSAPTSISETSSNWGFDDRTDLLRAGDLPIGRVIFSEIMKRKK